MATNWIKVKGKVKYAKVIEPDNFEGRLSWTSNFYPATEDDWAKMKAAKLNKQTFEDDDGKFVKLRRDATKIMGGKTVMFTGPYIEYEDGSVMIDYVTNTDDGPKRIRSYDVTEKPNVVRRGVPKLIGNGTEVIADIAVYDAGVRKGSRLEGFRLVNLVEYVPVARELPPVREDNEVPFDMSDQVSKPQLNTAVGW